MEKERNLGLDLLRMLCMLLVVVLHLLGRGGLLAAAQPRSLSYWTAWGLESAAYCAVNCYALTTGYLLLHSRCRTRGLLALWSQVFFYSAGLTALFALAGEGVSLPRFLASCFPVLQLQYWYFTAYFGLYCLAPFLNRLLLSLEKGSFQRLLLTLFLLFSLLPTLGGTDAFQIAGGYSLLWLLALYCGGAYLGRYAPRLPRPALCFLGYAGFVLAAFASKYAMEQLAIDRANRFIAYPSPLILGAALCLFGGFLQLRLRPLRRAIGFFAPASFGVYLIHTQPFVFNRLLDGALAPWATLAPLRLAGQLLLLAAAIYLACSLVDRLRMALFALLRLPRLTERAGDAWDALLARRN